MSWAFAALGLRPDADARAIKRAYAAQLKTVRPDEDPAGFQRLNEAYQAALEHCAGRAAVPPIRPPAPTPAQDAPAAPERPPARSPRMPHREPPPRSVPAPATTVPDGEAPDIAHCLRLAANWDHLPLIAWLDAQASLWSLDGKARFGRMLLLTMAHERPPVADHNFETLAKAFGYYDLHAGHDFLAMRELRAELHALWREARRKGHLQETPSPDASNVAPLSGTSMWRAGQRPPVLPGTQQARSQLPCDPTHQPRPHQEGPLPILGMWVLGTILFLLLVSILAMAPNRS